MTDDEWELTEAHHRDQLARNLYRIAKARPYDAEAVARTMEEAGKPLDQYWPEGALEREVETC